MRHVDRLIGVVGSLFQSTHPMRGATAEVNIPFNIQLISIHAPHAGCDSPLFYHFPTVKNFNPRTPCGVRRRKHHLREICIEFQSTHPMRGATGKVHLITVGDVLFQSTHPMRGATAVSVLLVKCAKHFNPRTPCGVRPPVTASQKRPKVHFNPRTPCGVRPSPPMELICSYRYFNPRTPCGVRPS